MLSVSVQKQQQKLIEIEKLTANMISTQERKSEDSWSRFLVCSAEMNTLALILILKHM